MTTGPEEPRGTRRWQDELSATGDELVGRVKQLVQESNVRRIIIRHDDHTLVEMPLTLGVVGTLLAPQVAALGALAALIAQCTVTIEREEPEPPPVGDSSPGALPPPGQ
jgi:hypothetical protein